jgi:hypothetical protein
MTLDELEKLRNLIQMTDPLASIREQYKVLDVYRNTNMLALYQENNILMQSEFNRFKSVGELLADTYNQFMFDFQKNINIVNTVFKDMSINYRSIADEFTRRYQEILSLENICKTAYIAYNDTYVLPTQRLLESIANAATLSKVYSVNDLTINLMIQCSIAYQDFTQRQLKHLANDQPVIAARRIHITDSFGTLYESNDAALGLYTDINIKNSYIESEFIIKPNIYGSINSYIGYAYNPNKRIDIDDAIENSLPTKINKTGCRIIELVYMINDLRRKQNTDEVFTITNRSIMACCKIPNLIANTELIFADIVDQLFFMLYEGSGIKDNRLVSIVGDKNKLGPLWKVKTFRLEFRHDIEHGNRKDIDKKYLNIGSAYKELIGCERPRTSRDWTAAQYGLYKLLADMLDEVHSAQYHGS